MCSCGFQARDRRNISAKLGHAHPAAAARQSPPAARSRTCRAPCAAPWATRGHCTRPRSPGPISALARARARPAPAPIRGCGASCTTTHTAAPGCRRTTRCRRSCIPSVKVAGCEVQALALLAVPGCSRITLCCRSRKGSDCRLQTWAQQGYQTLFRSAAHDFLDSAAH